MSVSAEALAAVARPFGDELWLVEGDPVRMLTIPFTTRMTVARLPDGGLWLHSPVAPTPARRAAVDALGPVRHVIAPNKVHNLFVKPWLDLHPDATSWAGPGLRARRPALRFDADLTDEAPGAWADVIDQTTFRGSKVLEDMVFVHRPSRALIVTDIIQNHDPTRDSWFWRWLKRRVGVLGPRGGVPRDWRATINDRDAARASLERVLAWDFDRVVLSHGLCVEHGGRAYVEQAFAWLQ